MIFRFAVLLFLQCYGFCVLCRAVLSHSIMSDLLRPHAPQTLRLLCPWVFSRQEYWSGLPWRRASPQPRDQTQVSHIVGRFFTVWVTNEAKNIGVGSLSLLQRIFLTQQSNRGLLHCRRILYQLSYQGLPPFCSMLLGDWGNKSQWLLV